MKHFVITIIDNDKSHYAADKCVESGKKFGLEIDYYEAFTPHTCFDFISEHKINICIFYETVCFYKIQTRMSIKIKSFVFVFIK